MVLRASIVLPIYMVILFFVPQIGALAPMWAAIQASGEQHLTLHAIGYGVSIPVSLALAAWCSRATEHYTYGALARITQITLIGVAVMSTYQMFLYFFEDRSLSVTAILIPLSFCVAELVYEIIAHFVDRMRARSRAGY